MFWVYYTHCVHPGHLDFFVMADRRLTIMASYLTFDEKIKRLRTLIHTIATYEEIVLDHEEVYNSNYDSWTDGDTYIETEIDLSNENDFPVGEKYAILSFHFKKIKLLGHSYHTHTKVLLFSTIHYGNANDLFTGESKKLKWNGNNNLLQCY